MNLALTERLDFYRSPNHLIRLVTRLVDACFRILQIIKIRIYETILTKLLEETIISLILARMKAFLPERPVVLKDL